jgi:hypothetical protein
MFYYLLQFLYAAQLARIVNPFMGPMRHMSFLNLRGKLKTFLLDDLTHFLFLGPARQQDFILNLG